MREKIAHALTTNVIRDSGATPGVPCRCNQSELASLGAPRSVIHFLQRTLARRAQIEVSERFSGSFDWFDMSGDSVQAALDNLRHVVTEAAQFPADEWPKAVNHAVGTMLDYLIDPVPTLLDFCYAGGSAAVSVGDLRRRAGYFREYPYVEQAVQAYTQKKGDKRVSRQELQTTLNHVVRQYTADFSVDDWMRTLEPLLEFVHVSGHVDGGLPVAFVIDFLAAHHRPDVASFVEVEARMAKADMISAGTLRRLVVEALETAREQAEAAAREEAAAERARIDAARQPETDTASLKRTGAAPGHAQHRSSDKGASKPLWQQYAEQHEHDTDSGHADNTDSGQAGGTSSAPLWKSFQDRLQPSAGPGSPSAGPGSSSAPLGELPDAVLDVLGRASGQTDHFIATLFKGDRSSFEDVIRRLQTAGSWSAASTILARDVFKRFDVDIYSDDAVAFTNAVEARYSE